MKNDLVTISGVSGYIDENGTAMLNLENIARGLGFTDSSKGVEYVRWNTVTGYLSDIGFSQEVAKDMFIPENIFYRLAFKASNKTAVDFQCKVADEILPTIRKHGFYGTPATIDTMLSDPDSAIKMLLAYKDEKQGRAVDEAKVKELAPTAAYYDMILKNPGLVTITSIAKDYGFTGQEINKLLHEYGIQFKQGSQWLLYAKFDDFGYVSSEPVNITRTNGTPDVMPQTKWTQKGRKFLYDFFKQKGILPIIEREPFLKADKQQAS